MEVFRDEIVPIRVPGEKKGQLKIVDVDEHPRPETTLDKLGKLSPAFKKDGTKHRVTLRESMMERPLS